MAEQLWPAALTGGLAGASLTQLTQLFVRWWSAPSLVAEFDAAIEGCVVDGEDGRLVAGLPGKTRYLRLRVTNHGRSIAKDVQVIVTRISGGSSPRWVSAREVLDLI